MSILVKLQERYYHTACEIFGVQPPPTKISDHASHPPGRRRESTSIVSYDNGSSVDTRKNEGHGVASKRRETDHRSSTVLAENAANTTDSDYLQDFRDNNSNESRKRTADQQPYDKNVQISNSDNLKLNATIPSYSETSALKTHSNAGKLGLRRDVLQPVSTLLEPDSLPGIARTRSTSHDSSKQQGENGDDIDTTRMRPALSGSIREVPPAISRRELSRHKSESTLLGRKSLARNPMPPLQRVPSCPEMVPEELGGKEEDPPPRFLRPGAVPGLNKYLRRIFPDNDPQQPGGARGRRGSVADGRRHFKTMSAEELKLWEPWVPATKWQAVSCFVGENRPKPGKPQGPPAPAAQSRGHWTTGPGQDNAAAAAAAARRGGAMGEHDFAVNGWDADSADSLGSEGPGQMGKAGSHCHTVGADEGSGLAGAMQAGERADGLAPASVAQVACPALPMPRRRGRVKHSRYPRIVDIHGSERHQFTLFLSVGVEGGGGPPKSRSRESVLEWISRVGITNSSQGLIFQCTVWVRRLPAIPLLIGLLLLRDVM